MENQGSERYRRVWAWVGHASTAHWVATVVMSTAVVMMSIISWIMHLPPSRQTALAIGFISIVIFLIMAAARRDTLKRAETEKAQAALAATIDPVTEDVPQPTHKEIAERIEMLTNKRATLEGIWRQMGNAVGGNSSGLPASDWLAELEHHFYKQTDGAYQGIADPGTPMSEDGNIADLNLRHRYQVMRRRYIAAMKHVDESLSELREGV